MSTTALTGVLGAVAAGYVSLGLSFIWPEALLVAAGLAAMVYAYLIWFMLVRRRGG